MMKYTSAIAIISLCAFVIARPFESNETLSLPEGFEPITRDEILQRLGNKQASSLRKRTAGGIYLCTGEDWTGTCAYSTQALCPNGCETQDDINQACVQLSSPFYQNIGSIGPDSGATIFVSSNGGCVSSDTSVQYPGTGDFSDGSAATSIYATTIYSGEGTYYGQYDQAGSCGITYPDSALIVALGNYWQNDGYDTPWCGRKVSIINTDSGTSGYGNTAIATVADTCESCDQTHLDMSKGLFSSLTDGDYDEGEFTISWNFCNLDGDC